MGTYSFRLREFFHLTFLRQMGVRLSGRSYAVKGGICLRFFFRSPRLSEDMDLDIDSKVRVATLQKAVDSILQSRPLLDTLLPAGIQKITYSKPKQTETTQRWKVLLLLGGGTQMQTKLEFSRRKKTIPYSSGIPDAELLNQHKLTPFVAQYYDAVSMSAQKISALASPNRAACRDLFDLHHLFSMVRVNASDVSKQLKLSDIQQAVEKAGKFTHRDFKEQVLPFLPEDMMRLYRDSAQFETLKSGVEKIVLEMLP